MRDARLWTRLEACHPDDVEADFPFTARLARDNGWSKGFARRVVTEYLRFAYLSRLGEGIVTPSDEVDQAWHLHLTYTRHYWEPFREALGGPLHHMPTKGGPDQDVRFRQAYARTLRLYRTEFGEPPQDIWPPQEIRFGKTPGFVRVNAQDVWIIRKPHLPNRVARVVRWFANAPTAALCALLATLSLLLGTRLAFAHGEAQGDTFLERLVNRVWHWATMHTTEFVLSLFIIALALAIFSMKSGGNSSGCSTGCGSSGGGGSGGSSGCSGCGGGD
ncbi:glycine-rich domain-containing protein [Roseibium aggregatum]|uniref:glycine-rich domain-containing protein n=1 Tax=Roseibium aggregatum TaxID=187304 RepID=UPI003A96A148